GALIIMQLFRKICDSVRSLANDHGGIDHCPGIEDVIWVQGHLDPVIEFQGILTYRIHEPWALESAHSMFPGDAPTQPDGQIHYLTIGAVGSLFLIFNDRVKDQQRMGVTVSSMSDASYHYVFVLRDLLDSTNE